MRNNRCHEYATYELVCEACTGLGVQWFARRYEVCEDCDGEGTIGNAECMGSNCENVARYVHMMRREYYCGLCALRHCPQGGVRIPVSSADDPTFPDTDHRDYDERMMEYFEEDYDGYMED